MTYTFEVFCTSSFPGGLISEVFVIYNTCLGGICGCQLWLQRELVPACLFLGLGEGPPISLYYIRSLRQVVCIYRFNFLKKYRWNIHNGPNNSYWHIDLIFECHPRKKLRGSKLIIREQRFPRCDLGEHWLWKINRCYLNREFVTCQGY